MISRDVLGIRQQPKNQTIAFQEICVSMKYTESSNIQNHSTLGLLLLALKFVFSLLPLSSHSRTSKLFQNADS